ncbi:hypothetical protein NA78x_001714 [Anatilimnocola sp. NA78]|uniref:hypothetical protein n=1 Tax=Anatilimnocola sp. NA78 TaxID=3415683 RepID=UPI003CE52955
MLRLLLSIAVICAMASPCFAQAKKKGAAPPPSKSISHGVGDRLTTTAPIIVAADEFDALEIAKSFEAKDSEGIKAMVNERKAITLEAGLQLVVLEITTFERRREDKSTVCRVIKDGTAIGKYAIHYTWFTTATMKMDKKAD